MSGMIQSIHEEVIVWWAEGGLLLNNQTFESCLILWKVVDGWELNGELFPSPRDHALDVGSRFNEFCGREERRNQRRTFTSS